MSDCEPWDVAEADCLTWLKMLPDSSVDALVTDPPAGIGFMGKDWDGAKGGRDQWVAWLAGVMREALRVLKPGAHGLVWSLPRTSHWTGTALEDAGFEVRDLIAHMFGTGFPKSLDVSKALDKAAGADPAQVPHPTNACPGGKWCECSTDNGRYSATKHAPGYAYATPEAQQWDGWGTALKPAREDWWLVRKPLDGTVAANVLAHGVGGLNVDGCRVGESGGGTHCTNRGDDGACLGHDNAGRSTTGATVHGPESSEGRWPPHLLFSEPPGELHGPDCWLGDKAKFFPRFRYQAKPSRKERELGLDHMPDRRGGGMKGTEDQTLLTGSGNPRNPITKNHHPTVKPIALMRWLCRLITPPGGLLIDPFTGSGTTGVAAVLEGFRFAGCEREPEYAEIARARIGAATHQVKET